MTKRALAFRLLSLTRPVSAIRLTMKLGKRPPVTFIIRTDPASFAEIVGYLERQYDDILSEESRIKRNPRFRDNRVHALLYFITPTGHGWVS